MKDGFHTVEDERGPGEPPSGHGPGSRHATREPREAPHGAARMVGPCICRWCVPYRYRRESGGGGHQEWAEKLELDGLIEEIEFAPEDQDLAGVVRRAADLIRRKEGGCAGEVRGEISARRSRAVWERNMVRVWNRAIQDAANLVRGEPGVDEERKCEEVAAQIEALLRDFDVPEVEEWYRRRDELSDTRPRSEEEEAELDILREKIWSLPTAVTPEAQEAMDFVHRAAELLRGHGVEGAEDEPVHVHALGAP